jgi:asparagine synthase (glutamine-hydrolysing)
MSFLAVINADGASIDSKMIDLMPGEEERNLKALGPSRQIALLWLTPDADLERKDVRHAVELDGQFWLLGRVRLDRRRDLCSLLGASEADSDVLLCLRAYAHWGDRCVERLYGDFCFVLWDERRRQLFCARDQLGVRPLFHACAKESWFVGDSLDMVARHSGLTDELDDFWVADFLTGPYCLDIDRTVYKYVKRLAPAHTLTVSRGGGVVKKYWALHLKEPIIYRRPSQYIDHFHHVLTRAIEDRLPAAGRVGISMSGGLDSTTLAAKTVEITGDASRVVAFTNYFERLIPDEEAHFSALVAERLEISHKLRAADDHLEFQASDLYPPPDEPGGPSTHRAGRRAIQLEMASISKVWFYGEGPDNALTFEWRAHLRWLARRRDWLRLIATVGRYIRGKEAREWLMTIRNPRSPPKRANVAPWAQIPEWLDKDFVEGLGLAARARNAIDRLRRNDSWRPGAVASFSSPIWQTYFELFDPVLSRSCLDARHPYTDLDVLSFMLHTPPIPWGRRKRLIRQAMRGVLPDEVVARDKAPLIVDPYARVERKVLLSPLSIGPTLRRFVDPARLPDVAAFGINPFDKVYELDSWLKGRQNE